MSDAINKAIEALRASINYINESPCDPDITAMQIVAYDIYLKSNPEQVLADLKAWQAAQAQAGERKCSECGNGEPDLSLYCVRCLNNDHWHLIDPAQAGGGYI